MMFRVQLDEPLFELIEHIACDTVPLGEVCESHDGVNPGNAKQKLIVAECGTDCLDGTHKKVLNGKNIGRYWLRWDGLYVRYDRSLLSKGDNVRWGHREALDSAKILTRQTADRLIGTFDAGQYYATNSIHTTILQQERHDVSLKYVLALLNSRVLSFYYRSLFPEVGQVFSQVKLVNLRQLPIKILSRQYQHEIVKIVDRLLKAAPFTCVFAGPEKRGRHAAQHVIDRRERHLCQVRELDEQLDRLIYAAYGLLPEHIQRVDREFGQPVTGFAKIEADELKRQIPYDEMLYRYCKQRQSIVDIAARYHAHPESVLALRHQYGVYREKELRELI
jgi:hypothetical protein